MFESHSEASEWIAKQELRLRGAIRARGVLRLACAASSITDAKFDAFILRIFRASLTETVIAHYPYLTIDERKKLSTETQVGFVSFTKQSPELRQFVHIETYPELVEIYLSQTSLDAAMNIQLLRQSPLWTGPPIPKQVSNFLNVFLQRLYGVNWSFWRSWYYDLWQGSFQDWELAHEIANIENDVWESDDALAKVAARIREIQRKNRTNVSPQLTTVSEGVWGIEDDVAVPQEPLDFAISQVEVALKAALAGQNNGLREDSGETVLIRSAVSDHRSEASVVAVSMWNACMSLQRNIGDIYPEESLLIVLQNTLYTSVEELCEQDDLIKTRIGKLAALETRRYPSKDEKEDLAKVPDLVAENLTEDAQKQLGEMVDIVVSEQKPPRFTRARLVNWLTTLGSGIDTAQKNEKRAGWLLDLARRIGQWFFKEDGE